MGTNAYRFTDEDRKRLIGTTSSGLPTHVLAEIERQRIAFIETHGNDGFDDMPPKNFCSKTHEKESS